MKDRSQEEQLVKVPWAMQARETWSRWAWVEPTVWTDRMLTALVEGVKGGRWFSLIDKVFKPSNLRSAFKQVRKNGGAAGVDRQTVEMFERHLDSNLEKLRTQLQEESYLPQLIRRTWIPKLGSTELRPLGIPTVRDRVVQTALRNAIEPIFERDFAEHSYGFRPGRGCKDALRQVERLLQAGYTIVVDADLKGYFDSISRQVLLKLVGQKISDGRILALIRAFLEQGVMEDMKEWTPEKGTPQGGVISPLLANIYLDPLDHLMAAAGFKMIRYADDFVILCQSWEEAEAALERVKQWTAQAELTLHPDKTHIVDATQPGGFDFLGYHFERGLRWPRKKSLRKLMDTIRASTRRTNGDSLSQIITRINPTLRGWYGYFRHSHYTTFGPLDSWIRMRLRSILRKRHKGRGRGRGNDHVRWPNRFFAEQGLFSLAAAHARDRQPTLW